jgi:ApaG protein
MANALTQQIDVTVKTAFQAGQEQQPPYQYLFAYQITITNNSPVLVQLLSRHWDIKDSLEDARTVDGAGVVGEQPLLLPGERYQYVSGCPLDSDIGAMKGWYEFQNPETQERFQVEIPKFTLIASWRLN